MRAVEATTRIALAAMGISLLAACQEREAPADTARPAEERAAGEAVPLWRVGASTVDIDDRTRFDTAWLAAPSVDSVRVAGLYDTPVLPSDSGALERPELPDSLFAIPETWDDLGADSTWAAGEDDRIRSPLGGKVAGPSVLRAQVLLDRAGFSPGVLDGRWGGNMERAVFWLQRREGLRPTGRLDSLTLSRLRTLAGDAAPLVAVHALSPEDVEGPFTAIPDDVYAQDDLDCLCPESALEKVAERAHTTPDVLRKLNPEADLDRLVAGDSLRVPVAGYFADGSPAHAPREPLAADTPTDSAASAAQRPPASPVAGAITRIIISDRGRYLHAFDAEGRLVHHFPATLGSDYNPSPEGRLEVRSVTFDPWFHYQPALLDGADPDDPSTKLAPGPNSPVGTVWIALSEEHYGIHGTNAPATIGYVTSSGCVRLTNWDAELLARRVAPGTVVEFRDVREAASADSGPAA